MFESYFYNFMLSDLRRELNRKEPKRSQGKRIVCCKCRCTGTLYKYGSGYICRKCRDKFEKK